MLPSVDLKMDDVKIPETKKERNFPTLELTDSLTTAQPVLVIQSPKTPTLSRKLKAVSLDSDPPKQSTSLEVSRDVFSMPNTPKRQAKPKLCGDVDEGVPMKATLTPHFSSNLKRFASNTSISGSQTLKTLPEIMTLQDFSDNRGGTEPIRIKAKGLLERRGSNASLTIDLGSSSNVAEVKPPALARLNTAKSVSNLYLSSFSTTERCACERPPDVVVHEEKKKETCGDCTIYESVACKAVVPASKSTRSSCQAAAHRKCGGCACISRCRRKSLSNENLYVPPCSFCQTGAPSECTMSTKHCKGNRKACYPRQPDVDASQLLSEDFKLHLQNNQYLQTAGNVLSVAELKAACETQRIPKLHQEFWAVPLNLQEKCLVSGSQSRNRYRGVLPNEHSRVQLPATQPYIHANYIKGPDYSETAYIATQGPMAHTCEDFWEMVWTAKSNCIVMLTGLVEKGRSKCELYFPLGRTNADATTAQEKSYYTVKTNRVQDRFTFDSSKNAQQQQQYEEVVVEFEELDEVQHGKYKIKYLGRETLGECALRRLLMQRFEGNVQESRFIYHYWYPDWQDHKMANPVQVLQIARHVLGMLERNAHDNNVRTCHQGCLPLVNGDSGGVTRVGESQKHAEKRPKPAESFRFDGYEKKSKISVDSQQTPPKTKPPRSRLSSTPKEERSPLVVHCSAGIGRTGCFLAILNGMQQLRANFNVDVLAILCSLRLNRGGLVQTAEQYELIHRVLSLYADLM